MNTYTYKPTFAAAAYGTDAYNSGTYDCSTSASTCTTPTNGNLVNTGSPWFIPVMLGAALIVAALILIVTKIVRRHKRNKA